jgi:hypothetical protein
MDLCFVYVETIREPTNQLSCGEGNVQVAPVSKKCIYELDEKGKSLGCKSVEHLTDCGMFVNANLLFILILNIDILKGILQEKINLSIALKQSNFYSLIRIKKAGKYTSIRYYNFNFKYRCFGINNSCISTPSNGYLHGSCICFIDYRF